MRNDVSLTALTHSSYKIITCVFYGCFKTCFLVVKGIESLQPESDDCVKLGNDLWAHTDEVTGRDSGCHDEHQVSEHCGGNHH